MASKRRQKYIFLKQKKQPERKKATRSLSCSEPRSFFHLFFFSSWNNKSCESNKFTAFFMIIFVFFPPNKGKSRGQTVGRISSNETNRENDLPQLASSSPSGQSWNLSQRLLLSMHFLLLHVNSSRPHPEKSIRHTHIHTANNTSGPTRKNNKKKRKNGLASHTKPSSALLKSDNNRN